MRLAYLVGTYPAVSHTFIVREVDELRRRGIEVHTFSVRCPAPEQILSEADRHRAAQTPSIQPPDWAHVLSAHARALLRSPRRWLSTLRLALTLSPGGLRAGIWRAFYFAEAVIVWDWCRRRRIDHLHAHFADSGCWIAMLAAAYAGEDLRFSFTMHGPTEFDDVRGYGLAEKVRRASFVACISDFCRSQLMKLSAPEHWDALQIVHCGLDLESYRPEGVVDHSGAPDSAMRVLCVGRLVAEKGQRVLIDAVARLRAEGIDVQVALVGDGPERAALERSARHAGLSDRVELLGARPPEEVRAELSRCDVFCLPSLAEGVPVVLMEAMAMQRPVVSTRIMGVPELVRDERDGLLVSPGDVGELAAALRRLSKDPDLRSQLGLAGREAVAAGFTLSDQVDRLIELFAEAR